MRLAFGPANKRGTSRISNGDRARCAERKRSRGRNPEHHSPESTARPPPTGPPNRKSKDRGAPNGKKGTTKAKPPQHQQKPANATHPKERPHKEETTTKHERRHIKDQPRRAPQGNRTKAPTENAKRANSGHNDKKSTTPPNSNSKTTTREPGITATPQ